MATLNLPFLLALQSINGLGPIRLKSLIEYYKDPKLIWEADLKELQNLGIPKNIVDNLSETRKKLEPEKYLEEIKKSGINFITIFDDDYPKLLKEIYDPPIILYFLGEKLPKNFERSIGVVGTRKVTGYGRVITEKFTSYLANNGFVIVSGLARGVDTIAHQTAVLEKGQTVAVLGGGLKNIYPPENLNLVKNIVDQNLGAIVSEFPPDYPSLPGNFPSRNRIISGLSRAVLITEATEDSGSLITAKCALDQGREVFAIPGPITSEYSKGPSLLIKQGAKLVTDPEEILEELGMDKFKNGELRSKGEEVNLNGVEKRVMECLEGEGKHIDEICRSLSLPASQISSTLIKMEILGLVKNLGGGSYIKSF